MAELEAGGPEQPPRPTRSLLLPERRGRPSGPRGRRPQAWRAAKLQNPGVPRLPPATRANGKQCPGWRVRGKLRTTGCFSSEILPSAWERLVESRAPPFHAPRGRFPRSAPTPEPPPPSRARALPTSGRSPAAALKPGRPDLLCRDHALLEGGWPVRRKSSGSGERRRRTSEDGEVGRGGEMKGVR